MRDRWHSALKNVNEGHEIDPDTVKIRNRPLYAFDAEADAMQRWQSVSSKVAEELRSGNVTPLFNVGGMCATEVARPVTGAVSA